MIGFYTLQREIERYLAAAEAAKLAKLSAEARFIRGLNLSPVEWQKYDERVHGIHSRLAERGL